MAVSIRIDGIDRLKKKIGAIPQNIITETDTAMTAIASQFVARASADAPQDNRTLANSITQKKVDVMNHEVVSPMPYSAYVEFGTKSRFVPIAGIDSSVFKGKGSKGGVAELYKNILEWVKRKGIAHRWSTKTHKPIKATKSDMVNIQETAAAITISILRHGIHPHPFFFKQLPQAKTDFNKAFKSIYKKALSK